MTREMTKSIPVSKRMVYDSYLKVCARGGSAGVDKVSIDEFNVNLAGNLYKIWNRMTSGSYFPPPVLTVFIPKKQGGVRSLGIPTVGDRIAQGVVKDYLEASVEAIFHENSFGYRPGKSAHDALKQCHNNCIKHPWVVDVDIEGFFDNINHSKLVELLRNHTQEKWVLLYVSRWLKSEMEQVNGSIVTRDKGTPQGGVVSPLLANIYLHHCFDKWMEELSPGTPFERYADDIIIHCESKEESEQVLAALKKRMEQYGLALHPDKTKIVYCKNYLRKERHVNVCFDFLGYSFRPRTIRDKFGKSKRFVVFDAIISQQSRKSIREKMRDALQVNWTVQTLEWFADKLNPKIRGWVNYYMKFSRSEGLKMFRYLNGLIRHWMQNKYKVWGGKLTRKYKSIQSANPDLFLHWRLGIK
jgi:RNA-directed DNA polymerase